MYKTGFHVVGYLTYSVLVILMSACSSNVVSIDANDSATFTTLETSLPVSRDDNVRIKLRASLTASFGSTRDSQTLNPG